MIKPNTFNTLCIMMLLVPLANLGCSDDSDNAVPNSIASCQSSTCDTPDSGSDTRISAPDLGVDAEPDTQQPDTEQPNADAGLDVEPDVETDTASPDISEPDAALEPMFWTATRLGLAYEEVGTAPSATLTVEERGGVDAQDPLVVEVTAGDFAIEDPTTPLRANERRELTVQYTGAVSAPVRAEGTITVTVGTWRMDVEVWAVVGDPDLPTAQWTGVGLTMQTVVGLPSAPYPYGASNFDDDSVLIALPDGLDPDKEVSIVAHMHGHNAVLEDVVARQLLVEQHGLSGRNAILIAPQGPYRASSGDFGKLMEPEGFAHLVEDVIALLYRDGHIRRPKLGQTVLTAHSGGYRAVARISEVGGIDIHGIHLFDALYGEVDAYHVHAAQGGLLRSLYTTSGGTRDNNIALAARLEEAGTPVGDSFTDTNLLNWTTLIAHSAFSHSGCLRGDRNFQRWLSYSGLPRHANAPITLISVEGAGETATVRWHEDAHPDPVPVRVEGSRDGETWEVLAQIDNANRAEVPSRPWFRVVPADGGSPSDRYGGTGETWLVVDGFDRALGGSWSPPTHGFAAALGVALEAPFSTASNEAVAEGTIVLSDYPRVLWMLGDESSDDITLDARERELLEDYIAGGGQLIITGSELGFATNDGWLLRALRVRYIADNAQTTEAGGYTFGVTYEEDFPDVLDGDTVIWRYATGGGAAVGWNRQVITVGFGLETIGDSERAAALRELVEWLE